MAELSLGNLKFKQKVQFIQKPNNGVILTMDCSVSETHSRESPPTEFEIESGQTVSDHIIVKPFSLEIQGIISNAPIRLLNSLASFVGTALLPPVGIIAGAAGLALYKALDKTDSPSVAAFKQIIKIQDQKQPFDVLTTLNRYKDMWIKSITIPRDAQNGNALVFTVSLVQLLLVQPLTVNIQNQSNANLTAPKANQGRQDLLNPIVQKIEQGAALARSTVGRIL